MAKRILTPVQQTIFNNFMTAHQSGKLEKKVYADNDKLKAGLLEGDTPLGFFNKIVEYMPIMTQLTVSVEILHAMPASAQMHFKRLLAQVLNGLQIK